ncbi:hypothetical protein M514_00764 [Trichuris suis]|uniref:G-protein coupled receptors family 1 profile domain-containing protein n=1 Tax=Trichuris suis TaxID=68888 RepID=A0A085MMU2_9BILA|nr:hypothetical protein M513_00764 [Trichuris suis]KFD66088.1 hypothetical protein M514_00764 [Trichuris suis]
MALPQGIVTNNATNATLEQWDRTSEAFMLAFAFIGIVSNAALFISALTTRPFRKRAKFIAAFSGGTLICDVGAAVILIHRSFRESQYGLMTAMQCLINVPSILLYSVGEPVMTLCSLIMSLDYCLTLTVSKPACKITERTASVLIAATVTISSVNALLTFLLVYFRGNVLVKNRCYQGEVMDALHVRINYCTIALCSLLSALIYMATAIITAAKKSTFPVVRLQQIRRQEAIMKYTSFVVLIMLLSHAIPFFLIVILSYKVNYTLDSIIFYLYLIFSSAFPVRIFCAKLFAWLLLVKSKVCLSKAKVSAQGCSPTKSLDAANRE